MTRNCWNWRPVAGSANDPSTAGKCAGSDGGSGDTGDPVLVIAETLQLFAAVELPVASHRVVAAGKRISSVSRKRNSSYLVGVPGERCHNATAIHFPKSNGLVVAAGEDMPSVRGKCNAANRAGVPFESGQQFRRQLAAKRHTGEGRLLLKPGWKDRRCNGLCRQRGAQFKATRRRTNQTAADQRSQT